MAVRRKRSPRFKGDPVLYGLFAIVGAFLGPSLVSAIARFFVVYKLYKD